MLPLRFPFHVTEELRTLLLACGLALTHFYVGKLRFLRGIPRSRWLSFSGGVSVSYVFLHLLPELGEAQERLAAHGVLTFLETHAYLLALAGLSVFYGLERLTALDAKGPDEHSPPVFWLHISSFALYNALIGYLLLHREETGVVALALYGAAMGLHFIVNDFGLRERFGRAYHQRGRWLLVLAILAGWAAGVAVDVGDAAVAALLAVLAGSVVLNVLKEELPENRESRFSAFIAGAAFYAVVLLAAA